MADGASACIRRRAREWRYEFHVMVRKFFLAGVLGKKPMLGDPIKSDRSA